MIRDIVLLLFPLLFIQGVGCSIQNKSNSSIEAFEVRDTSPVMGETSYRVFYLDSLVMYQIQYRQDSIVNQLQFDSSANKITSSGRVVSSEWKSRFWVFHSDSSYGLLFDPNSEVDAPRLKVDFMIRMITGTNRWDSFLYVRPDSAIWNSNRSELREVFLFPANNNMPASRLVLHYSKTLNHLKISFNKKVDSVKQMKLFKTEYYVDAYHSEKDSMSWPPSRSATEMTKIMVKNEAEILRYFKKYAESIAGQPH